MIKLTKEELEAYVPLNNLVLIKPGRGRHELITSLGAKFTIDYSYEPEKHVPCHGTVLKGPESLDCSEMDWQTTIECRPSDRVFFDYSYAIDCFNDSFAELITCENEPYLLIPYEALFLAKRDTKRCCGRCDGVHDECIADVICDHHHTQGCEECFGEKESTIPLNGYCLIEALAENILHKSSLQLPHSMKDTLSISYGKVLATGSLIPRYRFSDHYPPDSDNVKPHDIIAFDNACDIPIEFPLHSHLFNNKTIFRVQRRFIVAKVNKPEEFGLKAKEVSA